MGLLNSSLQTGRSAILGYQSALQVVGNNISSAASPDYTRLAPGLDPLQGSLIGRDLQPGAGVALTSIQRNIDEALEGRVRTAIGTEASAAQQREALTRVESFFDTLNGTDLSSRLTNLFRSFDDLQNTPEDSATRDLAISGGVQLADSIRGLRSQFGQLAADLDRELSDLVPQVNDLTKRIARLNAEITTAESGSRGQATGLRDQRDALLRELSELVGVTVREQPNGALNVYAGSEALVQGAFVRELVGVQETDGEFVRTSVRFVDTNGDVDLGSGRMAGLIASRDERAAGQVAALDELAAAIIADVNRIHADGQGLRGLTTVTGSHDLLATNVALNGAAAGLTGAVTNGSFFITVLDDATQTPIAHRIDVNVDGPGTPQTLDDLVAAINSQVTGVTAAVTSDRRLSLTATPGSSFVFGYDGQQERADTSGVLAALGVNTFFSGSDATNIAVNNALIADPLLLAAASTFHAGDGVIAGRIAALDSTPSAHLNDLTLTGFYDGIANEIAVTGAAATDASETASAVLSALRAQRESLSGVNLDEEAISLIKYERAFQGASRFVSVVNNLLNELVTLIR